MKIKRREHSAVKANTQPVMAADDDETLDNEFDVADDTEGINDTLDDVADTIDDMQDDLEDVDEDDPDIPIENNISNHYIAECDGCQGIFISAVVESGQEIDHISGVCPLCGKKTDQYLKWVIRDIEDAEDETIDDMLSETFETSETEEGEEV